MLHGNYEPKRRSPKLPKPHAGNAQGPPPAYPSAQTVASTTSAHVFSPRDAKLSMLREALVGIEHLHAHGIIHGAVKIKNILVDDSEGALRQHTFISQTPNRKK